MTDKPEQEPLQPEPQPSEAPAADEGATAEPSGVAAELAETRDALLRAHADMDNLRKRTARELDEARRYAVTSFARDLLEVSDNLARAVQSIPPEVREQEGWAQNLAMGVEMTERVLQSVFEQHRIIRIAPAKGDKFDHQRHQAMYEVATDQLPPGTIADVQAVGYAIADRLLRPALVGVAKAPAPQPASASADQSA